MSNFYKLNYNNVEIGKLYKHPNTIIDKLKNIPGDLNYYSDHRFNKMYPVNNNIFLLLKKEKVSYVDGGCVKYTILFEANILYRMFFSNAHENEAILEKYNNEQ